MTQQEELRQSAEWLRQLTNTDVGVRGMAAARRLADYLDAQAAAMEAAAAPQPQPAAVRVRIAVMVDAEGHWAAYAWGTGEKLGLSSAETMATVSEMMTDYGGVERWIEADVPLPQPAQIIEGEVTP